VQYLGIDVHSIASVWCLLDEDGEIRARGKVETTVLALGELVAEFLKQGELRVGQEVGTMAYLVHDAVAGAGVEILSFNAHQLRMIASSRKKTDRRDAYWIARALQSGMYPHPVYIPKGEIRELRALLTRRRMIQTDRNRWQYRARSALRASGYKVRTGGHYLRTALEQLLASPQGIDGHLGDLLELCQRQEAALSLELRQAEAELRERTQIVEAIGRLQTIPGVGTFTATTIYAWVGDVRRFPDAKALAAYAGLVPSIRQSGEMQRYGSITKTGSKALRSTLVQAAHVLMSRCRSVEAKPLQAIGERVRTSRGRRKIATVALARHILRITYYLLRDGTVYDPRRLRAVPEAQDEAA
jgi:transposase